MYYVKLIRSPNQLKKYRAIIYINSKKYKYVDFGQYGASDYTIHKDYDRMIHYLSRHTHKTDWKNVRSINLLRSSKEDWDNIFTAGFWSRWLLWSLPSLRDAKKLISKKFRVQFVS